MAQLQGKGEQGGVFPRSFLRGGGDDRHNTSCIKLPFTTEVYRSTFFTFIVNCLFYVFPFYRGYKMEQVHSWFVGFGVS